MKISNKISLILLILFFISLRLVVAEKNCELAIPRYGIIECINLGQQETKSISLQKDDKTSFGNFQCLSNCKLNTMTDIPQAIDCGAAWGVHIEIRVNGEIKYQESSTESRKDQDISFNRGDELSFRGYCRGLIMNTYPLPISTITVKQDLIMLKEGWAGSLPTTTIPNTEGCSLNKVADRYKGDKEVSSFLNPATGQKETKPSATYSSVYSMPNNWEIGQNYIFVKDWQTGIADISLTYDKDNKGYWCGGQSGSRNIYSVNEITSNTGRCYAIPTSIYLSNVECCFPSDCSMKGTEYTCNPDTWKCEETKWCDSDLDCQQVFGEGVCQSKTITKWLCDSNKKWGTHQGTCEKQLKPVSQCPSDCTSDEYYNDVEGKCKPRTEYIECPPGKCCDGGGSYKPMSCSSGLTCCKNSGALLGECKVSCEETKPNSKEDGLSGVTGDVVKKPNKIPPIMGVIIGLIVLVGIGVAVFLLKGRVQVVDDGPRKAKVTHETGKFCEDCGSPLSNDDKFCIDCGKKKSD